MRDHREVEAYLHAHIPITRSLGLAVRHAGPSHVELGAPLTPNLNHEATAFGGSISALAILAGWTWLCVNLESVAAPARIVIQRSAVRYIRPVEADFTARCDAPAAGAVDRLRDAVTRHRRGRIDLAADVRSDGEVAARFHGTYVVIQ